MDKGKSIGIGLMGLGVVGGGVAKVLVDKAEILAGQAGIPLVLKRVLVRELGKQRPVSLKSGCLVTESGEIVNDPEINIVVEVMGGEYPAAEYIREALIRGKHVVTANKEVMAKQGLELLTLAEEHGVELRYEASVGGGIPLIAPFQQDLIANNILAIHAIINGTTNYILTQMTQGGLDFSAALEQAQELGYAEADPSNDVEGVDAAYKLAILATLAFRIQVKPEDVYCEGISRLKACDFRYAHEFGYVIKLLAIAKGSGSSIEVRVHPTFIPENVMLAKVDGVYNAVQVEGDLMGKVIFYGEGAGTSPTSSAVVADIMALAQNIRRGATSSPRLQMREVKTVKSMFDIETRYYLRLNVADQSGVLAQISKALGDCDISISSVIQKEADPMAKTAELVIMTHPARERAVQQALEEVGRLPVVKEISNFVRVEA